MDKIGRITTGGEITEFLIPVSASARPVFPFDMTSGPDGALWFNVAGAIPRDAMMPYTALGIGRITTGGEFSEFLLPPMARLPPLGLTAGPDGALWFTEELDRKIGRITTTGKFSEFPMPNTRPHGALPSTLPDRITAGPDGALWFTEANLEKIGRITTAGAVTEFRLPSASTERYQEITAGPDCALWVTHGYGNQIRRITTTGAVTEVNVPTPKSRPWGITIGPDGALWFTEQLANKIGRLTTAGEFSEFLLPTPNNFPYSITTGPDGAIWFVEGNQNESKIGRITVAQDQKNDSVQSVRIPQAASDCSEPRESADKVRGRTAWPLREPLINWRCCAW